MADPLPDDLPAAPRKRRLPKLVLTGVALLALVGGGVAAGVYASGAGLIGGGHEAPAASGPRLVPKSEQKHAATGQESEAGSGGGHGEEGGEKYASNYYQLDKDFTANLQDSIHVIQVGLAVSTPYDDKVVANLKTNEIAVRSAVLMALGDTPEDEVFSSAGKKKLAARLVAAMNDTLKQKEGFGGVGNVYFTSFVVQ